MGSQAAWVAFAAPVVAQGRGGAWRTSRIAGSAGSGDGERRVSCAAASSRGAPGRNCNPCQNKATSALGRRHGEPCNANARGSPWRSSNKAKSSDHDDGPSWDVNLDDDDSVVPPDSDTRVSGSASNAASSSSSRVVEFVAAWDALSPRLAASAASGSGFVNPGGNSQSVRDARGNREMLLGALKLAIPRLQAMPLTSETTKSPGKLLAGSDTGDLAKPRQPHERAVAVTLALADCGMDAECMSAGLLRDALIAGTVTLSEIETSLGSSVMRLTHDCARLQKLPGRIKGSYDDATADKLRTFTLQFHDARAIVVELAYRADALRNPRDATSKVQRTALALETMQLYAPIAHALDAGSLCASLEDLALRELFPSSYRSLERWLRNEGPVDDALLERARVAIHESLCEDRHLMTIVGGPNGISVKARRKSLFSTMRKVLRDGRPREDVHDLLGMRVIVTPQPGSPAYDPVVDDDLENSDDLKSVSEASDSSDASNASNASDASSSAAAEKSALAACYRIREITHTLFDTVPGRQKDYLARPKRNGYRSLHSTLKLPSTWEDATRLDTASRGDGNDSDDASLGVGAGAGAKQSNPVERRVELQVRTSSMHRAAEAGAAGHAGYKGGFKTDPGAADALATLVNTANAAAEQRFGMYSETGLAGAGGVPSADSGETADSSLFAMFDLNGDGVVTRDELRTVIGSVWSTDGHEEGVAATSDDLLTMLDLDESGTISAEEFKRFVGSLKAFGSLPGADAATAAAIEGSFTREEEDDTEAATDETFVRVDAISPDTESVSETSGLTTENALAALALSNLARPPLPPTPAPPKTRTLEDAVRDAGKALRDKTAGDVEWQLVWDLQRCGKHETARELFYQRTSKTPNVTSLWEQWARFELLQGDYERARGLYRAALLHAEGRPRARAESLRKWAVMEHGAGDATAAGVLFERSLRVLGEAEIAVAAIGEDDELLTMTMDEKFVTSVDDSYGQAFGGKSKPPPGIETEVRVESAGSLRMAQAAVLSSWSQVLSRAGDCATARGYLVKAKGLDGNNVYVLHSLARLDELAGDYAGAVAMYGHILQKVDACDAHASLSLAKVLHEKLGDFSRARDVFATAANANPTNYKILQAWAVMEARGEDTKEDPTKSPTEKTFKQKRALKKQESSAESLDAKLRSLAVARPLFQRASLVAPWSAHVWCAWANAEWRATRNPDTARELYSKGLAVDPTNVFCLRSLGEVERVDGRQTQARDYLERALDLEPGNKFVLKELGKLENELGNKARAAQYFNVAKSLGKESVADLRTQKDGGGGVRNRGGSRGVWAPSEAAAAARGVAAANAAKGASYRRTDLEGGEAGGGKHGFRSVLAASRGEAAAVRRDRGERGVAGVDGAIVPRRRVKSTWRRREKDGGDTEPLNLDKSSVGIGKEKKKKSFDIGSSLDAIGSSLDGVGSSLDDTAVGNAALGERSFSKKDKPTGGYPKLMTKNSVDAGFETGARRENAKARVPFGSVSDEGGGEENGGSSLDFSSGDASGTVDSMDEDMRRYTRDGRKYD